MKKRLFDFLDELAVAWLTKRHDARRKLFYKADLINGIKELAMIAEEHRVRYNTHRTDYWNGRRDEAGWFRDLLNGLLNKDMKISKSLDKLLEQLQHLVDVPLGPPPPAYVGLRDLVTAGFVEEVGIDYQDFQPVHKDADFNSQAFHLKNQMKNQQENDNELG